MRMLRSRTRWTTQTITSSFTKGRNNPMNTKLQEGTSTPLGHGNTDQNAFSGGIGDKRNLSVTGLSDGLHQPFFCDFCSLLVNFINPVFKVVHWYPPLLGSSSAGEHTSPCL